MSELSIILAPMLSALSVAFYAYGIFYVDTLNPGVGSPTPFSADPNGHSHLHLCFVGAIASGVIVTLVMYPPATVQELAHAGLGSWPLTAIAAAAVTGV
ncbi:hypothetical protein ACLKA7_006574 [Drosophila subpalustris]